ncbi:MAG: hypothetical protein H0U95_03440 [Bacteroidetes bacterium]|nr:hypothetical protein [Bacteroidota bacterium]
MKTKIIYIVPIAVFISVIVACSSNGNTGNGAADTGIKVGSGVSDSLDPEKGTYDTSTTPRESKKDVSVHH